MKKVFMDVSKVLADNKFKIEEKKLITSICISADITKGSKLEITIKR